ncbi:MAG: hypothetical protein HY434_01120 [Candidatus Liptonbacteria bacterium]|nr:hypothetical protein [Candidatus Liptonbacteria bacterium]
MKNKKYFISIIGPVALGIGLLTYSGFQSGPTNLGPFASCLKDKGVLFYGAFWCPHCQKQKAMFGNAADQLPYIECSTPDGQNQIQECIDKNIRNYPTWAFPGGSRLSGEIPLQTLADKSGCTLPK